MTQSPKRTVQGDALAVWREVALCCQARLLVLMLKIYRWYITMHKRNSVLFMQGIKEEASDSNQDRVGTSGN